MRREISFNINSLVCIHTNQKYMRTVTYTYSIFMAVGSFSSYYALYTTDVRHIFLEIVAQHHHQIDSLLYCGLNLNYHRKLI